MMMNYFVNGRYIKSPVITSAVEHAYKEFLMSHRYPFVTLMLSIDSSAIDVNVHPTKMEVRFTNQKEVYELFYDTVYKALKENNLIPEVSLSEIKASARVPEREERHPEPFEKERQEQEK